MRVLSLRFKNLNALVGEWLIDFTDPAYEAEGIFAITGPTGAGKTTILDALCLALYGRTPRLGAITQSSNEIMSRHTGDCFAEVVFATQAGRFRCFWGQHRARRHAEGSLQPARHELADETSGTLIVSGVQAVQQTIPEITGLDFERFTRSMLLAQGSFAAFLQADADERAPLLEQITGTGIYAEISKVVHEKRRTLQQQYDAMQSQAERITVLSSEEEEQLRKQAVHCKKQVVNNEKQLTQLKEWLQWRRNINSLNIDLQALFRQEKQLKEEIKQFQPQLSVLKWAEKALAFEGQYVTLLGLKEQVVKYQNALAQAKRDLPTLEQSYKAKQDAYAQLLKEKQIQEGREDELQALWEQVQQLDEQLQKQQLLAQNASDNKEKHSTNVQKNKERLSELQQETQSLEKQWQQIERYQQKHSADAQLGERLGRLQLRIERLLYLHKEVDKQNTDIQEVQSAVQSHEEQLQKLDGQHQEQIKQQKKIKDKLAAVEESLHACLRGESLRHLRDRLEDAREKYHLRQLMAEFETHRAHLKDGEPCPLCGALEHPLSTKAIPTVDEYQQKMADLAQLIERAESCQEQIEKYERELRGLDVAFSAFESNLQEQKKKIELGRQRLSLLQDQLEDAQKELEQLQKDLANELQPFELPAGADLDWQEVLSSLQKRWEKWQYHLEQQKNVQQKLNNNQLKQSQLLELLKAEETALKEEAEKLGALEQQLQKLQEQRRALFGTQTVAQARNSYQEELKKLQLQLQIEDEQLRQAQRAWELKNETIKQNAQQLQQLNAQLEKEQQEFLTAISKEGFQGWDDYQQRRLSTEQRQGLQQQAQSLEHEQIRLDTAIQERSQRLEQEKSKELTALVESEIQLAIEQCQTQLREVNQKYNELSYQLRANEQAKKCLEDQQEAALKQQKELERWSALHDLIGSSDGKRFRNFAQGLSFAQLVYYANQQMQTMSDRYLLQQDQTNPLLLNVIDNYQGGIVRSTQNLSGGESFIVSLALALGLSKMASHNVRIDSLFLDEGFGTLDEEALSLALDALANLRHDSKLIGVISHVSTLKERIGTQIEVVTNQRGHSRLKGPGCQMLS